MKTTWTISWRMNACADLERAPLGGLAASQRLKILLAGMLIPTQRFARRSERIPLSTIPDCFQLPCSIEADFIMTETVSDAAKTCLDSFGIALRKTAGHELTSEHVIDQLQRFNSWAGNINVWGEPHTTLDYRIGDAGEIRSLFVRLLQAIKSVLARCGSHLWTSSLRKVYSPVHSPTNIGCFCSSECI